MSAEGTYVSTFSSTTLQANTQYWVVLVKPGGSGSGVWFNCTASQVDSYSTTTHGTPGISYRNRPTAATTEWNNGSDGTISLSYNILLLLEQLPSGLRGCTYSSTVTGTAADGVTSSSTPSGGPWTYSSKALDTSWPEGVLSVTGTLPSWLQAVTSTGSTLSFTSTGAIPQNATTATVSVVTHYEITWTSGSDTATSSGYHLGSVNVPVLRASSVTSNRLTSVSGTLAFAPTLAKVDATDPDSALAGFPITLSTSSPLDPTLTTSPGAWVSASGTPFALTLSATAPTNGSGVSNFNVTLNHRAGTSIVAWVCPDGVNTATSTVVTAGATTTASIVRVNPADTTASTTVGTRWTPALQVQLLDAFGNAVSGTTARLSGNGLTSTVSVVTNASGYATFTYATASTTANSSGYTITVTSSDSTAPSVSTTWTLFTEPGAPASITTTVALPISSTVATLYTPFDLKVMDRYGNTISGTQVSFSIPGSSATLTGTPSTVTTNSSGIATVRDATASTTASVYGSPFALSAISVAVSTVSTSIPLANVPEAPYQMVGGKTLSAALSTAFATISTTVVDIYGNPVWTPTTVYFTSTVATDGATASFRKPTPRAARRLPLRTPIRLPGEWCWEPVESCRSRQP
ncbi:MAG: hypothetical protein WCI05_01705 [Myxococcales bacterium]